MGYAAVNILIILCGKTNFKTVPHRLCGADFSLTAKTAPQHFCCGALLYLSKIEEK